ncbi:MAG: neutral/alkaline non-lysosomal ceramidase N-terminal domain-containing protein [Planctomycetes bacterium]|nr:neutral/alkaline non-lysosomal ceramidase N-terminal domain-containing protein [Planctomycetota bacterium]
MSRAWVQIVAAAGSGCLALLAGCVAESVSRGARVEVGAATRTITPRVTPDGKAVWLAGFNPHRQATGVHDDLFARALAIRDTAPGGKTIAICVVDLVGFFRADVLEVRSALETRGVRLDAVIVTSTHTHSGPDTMGLWGPMPGVTGLDAAYNATVRDRCVDAIAEAVSKLRPATTRLALSTTPGLVNDSRLPRVLDERLRVLAFDDATTGAPIATFVNWSCHPECLPRTSTAITADLCAPLVARIERERGGIGIFANGAIGGLMTPGGVRVTDPRTGDVVLEDTFRHAEVIGEAVAGLALDAIRTAPRFDPTPIRFRSREVDIPLENDLFRGAAAIGMFGDRVKLLPNGRDLRTEVGLLRLGEATLACIPGEIYPELMFGGVQDPADPAADFPSAPIESAIDPVLPRGPHFVLGLANDEIGYIIPRREWDSKPPFAYGRSSAQYGEVNSVGPSAAAAICEALRALSAEP